MIFATCAALIAGLASIAGGQTYYLTEDCAPPLVRHYFEKPVVIEATGRTITGFGVLKGGNVTINGGILTSRGGESGAGQAGYAVYLSYAKDVRIEGARFVNFNRGVVPNWTDGVTLRFNTFDMGQDGVIATGGSGLNISYNTFNRVSHVTTKCTVPPKSGAGGVATLPTGDTIIYGLAKRDCVALGGVSVDGWHQDAIQVRNGIARVTLVGNTIRGPAQGIGEFKAAGDVPLKSVLVFGNDILVDQGHSITFYGGTDGIIRGNSVDRKTAGRTVIRFPESMVACDNRGQRASDPGQGACK